MRLVDVAVISSRRHDVEAVANARRGWLTRRGLLLLVRDERGRVGQGEASPLPGYSPEAFGTARRALKQWCDSAPPRLDLDRPLDAVRRLVATVPAEVPSARFAVETALLDLVGQRLEVPVWSLLAGVEVGKPVPLAGLITAANPTQAVEQAQQAVVRGRSTLKVKVGRTGALDDEMAVLTAVRAAVGDAVALRLDANGCLPPADLQAVLARLATVGPVLVEEPVSGSALAALATSPVPVAVDETLQQADGWSAVESLASRGLLAAVVLKPMALGGALACLDRARSAATLGVGAYVTHLFDGPLAREATAHVALALPRVPAEAAPLACGLDAHAALVAWPTVSSRCFDGSMIQPSSAPGLGLDRMRVDGDASHGGWS